MAFVSAKLDIRKAVWGGQASFVDWWFVSSFPTFVIPLGRIQHILALRNLPKLKMVPVKKTQQRQASSWALFTNESCLLVSGLIWRCYCKTCEQPSSLCGPALHYRSASLEGQEKEVHEARRAFWLPLLKGREEHVVTLNIFLIICSNHNCSGSWNRLWWLNTWKMLKQH